MGGLYLGRVDLRHASSKQAVITAVREAAQKLPPGEWVLGGAFNDNLWGGGLPDATWLDEV